MKRFEHLLTTLAEECNEVGQRCSKALRFGLKEVQPGQELNNADRILVEYLELIAMVELLMDEGYLTAFTTERVTALIDAKKAKVEEFLELSRRNGCFEDVYDTSEDVAN